MTRHLVRVDMGLGWTDGCIIWKRGRPYLDLAANMTARWHECVIDGRAGITGVHKSMDLNFTRSEDLVVLNKDRSSYFLKGPRCTRVTHPYPSL